MKATRAGQIIGYALQSSDEMKDGKLLMWLQIGTYLPEEMVARVNAASAPTPEIAALRDQVTTLQQQNAVLETRLAALEQTVQAKDTSTHSDNNPNLAVLVMGTLLGIVVVRRPWQGGAR